eukprot:Gb_29524 [translate_table: standard]
MAGTMECEASKRDFLLENSMKDGDEEFHGELELSLGLSLGGSIGKSKEKDKEKDGPFLRKFPSGNLQPSLKKFASGNLHGMVEKDDCVSSDNIVIDIDGGRGGSAIQEIWKDLSKDNKLASSPLSRSLSGSGAFRDVVPLALSNGSATKGGWAHHVSQQPFNTGTPSMVQNGTTQQRILRTCSLGATVTGLVPSPSSILHKQPSLDVLLHDRKQEGVQPTMQKDILEQQRKREVHAMRRQEARKKREEKQQKKARRDEGKSASQSKASAPFPTTGNAIPSINVVSQNKWMLNSEQSVQTNLAQMDPKEEGKVLLEIQRSFQRDKDRTAKENAPRSEKEKGIKKKGGEGSMDPLPGDFATGSSAGKAGIPNFSESKLMESQDEGNISAPTTISNSPMKGECFDRDSKETCETEQKSSSSNAEDFETINSRNQSAKSEISVPGRNTSTSYSARAISILPMPYPFQMPAANAQCMPLPLGFSFPYMMPLWTPTAQSTGSETSKCSLSPVSNVPQSISTHGFPPFQMPIPGTLHNWLPVPQAKAGPAGSPGTIQFSHASGTSSGRSSSLNPDQESKSSEGASSNDTKSQSSTSVETSWKGFQSLSRVPSVSNTQGQILSFSEVSTSNKLEPPQCTEAVEKIPSSAAQSAVGILSSAHSQEKRVEALCNKSSRFDYGSNKKKQNSSDHGISQPDSKAAPTQQTMDKSINDTLEQDNSNSKPAMPCPGLSGGNGVLPNLHWVSTTGAGPNGITISGILSSYSRSQVRIVCICHGTQMSPAEFVQHAGSTDLSNPERSIVVSPIPVGIPATSARG